MSDWTKIPQEVLDVLNKQLYLISAKSLTRYFLKPGDTILTRETKKDPLPQNYDGFKVYWQREGDLSSYYVYQDPDGEFIDIYCGYDSKFSLNDCITKNCIRQYWYKARILRILVKHQYRVVNVTPDFSLNQIFITDKKQIIPATETQCVNASSLTTQNLYAPHWDSQDLRWGSVTICGTGAQKSADPALNKQWTTTPHPDTIKIIKGLKAAPGYARVIANQYWGIKHISVNDVLNILNTAPYTVGNQKKYASSEYDELRKLAADPRENIITSNGNCVDIKDSGVVFHHINLTDATKWCSGLFQSSTLQLLPYKDNFRLHDTDFVALKQKLQDAAPTEELKQLIQAIDANHHDMIRKVNKACKQTSNTKYDDITQEYANKYAAQEMNTYGKTIIKVDDLIKHQLYIISTPMQKKIMHKVLTTVDRPNPFLYITNLEHILGGKNLAVNNWLYLSTNLKMCAYVCVLALTCYNLTEWHPYNYYGEHHHVESLDPLEVLFKHFHLDMSTPETYAQSLSVLSNYINNDTEFNELVSALSAIESKPEIVSDLQRITGFTKIETFPRNEYILTGIADLQHDNIKIWTNHSYLSANEGKDLQSAKELLEKPHFYCGKIVSTVTTQKNILNIHMDCKNRGTYYGVLNQMLGTLLNSTMNLI